MARKLTGLNHYLKSSALICCALIFSGNVVAHADSEKNITTDITIEQKLTADNISLSLSQDGKSYELELPANSLKNPHQIQKHISHLPVSLQAEVKQAIAMLNENQHVDKNDSDLKKVVIIVKDGEQTKVGKEEKKELFLTRDEVIKALY